MFVAEWSGIKRISPNGCYELHEICEIPAYSEHESNWVCLQRCIRIKVLCVFFLSCRIFIGKRNWSVNIWSYEFTWNFCFYFILAVVPWFYKRTCHLHAFDWIVCLVLMEAIGSTFPSCSIFLDLLVLIMFGERYKLWISPSCSFLICAPKFRCIHAHPDTSLYIAYLCVIL